MQLFPSAARQCGSSVLRKHCIFGSSSVPYGGSGIRSYSSYFSRRQSGSGRLLRIMAYSSLVAVSSIGATSAYMMSKFEVDAELVPGAIVRFSRDAWTCVRIFIEYQKLFMSRDYATETNEERKQDMRNEKHKLCAEILRELFCKNSGIYIKIGQHISQLQHLLPEPYVKAMEVMLNKAPQRSFHDVQRVIQEDLGKDINEIFTSFDPVPIASASLAQVHIARKDGEKLAVKVQHRELIETSRMDIWCIDVLVHALYRLYPSLDYRWLVSEVKYNLPRELDFIHEAENSKRFAKHVSHMNNVSVPKVHEALTSKRVLCMKFEEGFTVTDTDLIEKNNMNPKDVARLLSQVFCEQIFISGFVHADPHPGNILVRPGKRKSWFSAERHPELVVLDHGLYRELDDDFRITYARLWRSIILGDENGIRDCSEKMNAGDAYPLFASMLTLRPWDKIICDDSNSERLKIGTDIASRNELKSYAQMYALEITKMLGQVPRPLLLLLKTNDILRNIDMKLSSPVNTFELMARYCVKAINRETFKQNLSWNKRVSIWIETWSMEIRLIVVKILQFVIPFPV